MGPSAGSVRARLRSFTTRNRLRVAFLAILLVCGASLASSASTDVTTASQEGVPEAPPTENHTVVTESARYGTIIAYAPSGDVTYYDNTHTKYFDVDPVEGTSMTVEYTATDTIHTERPVCESPPCARNTIERVNLSTGEVTEVYTRYAPRETAAEWHDADRLDERHVVLADMADDEVSLVDTETEMVEWTWEAQSEFPVEGGGPYPNDWAHINDVEILGDGRVMISLRNQDQVVFVDPETGMQEEWTLGAEDEYSTQHEQHNPDYIPAERGGPAVVLADSENGRVEEFQRENGTWNRTWEWADRRLQWPRDADRLPNGNTLVTDTNGGRVVEVDPQGDVVWRVELSHPYEAERLETGDESTGGRSATSLGLESQRRDSAGGHSYDLGPVALVADAIRSVLPPRVTNAIIYVSPTWVGLSELGPVFLGGLTALTWIGLESWWFVRSGRFPYRLTITRTGE